MSTLPFSFIVAPEGAWKGCAVAYGLPRAMGSKRGFVAKGRAIIVNVGDAKLKSFQAEMRDSMRLSKPREPKLCAFRAHVEVILQRPKGHYGTGRNASVLKPYAPLYARTKPDADKVVRAVLDCGTGIWWRDDSQVCALSVLKRYAAEGEEQQTTIEAEAIEDAI